MWDSGMSCVLWDVQAKSRMVTRASQIIPFFLPIILFDYSQKLSPLFPFSIPIILMLKSKKDINFH